MILIMIFRGKYAKIYKEGIIIVRLDIDIIKFFSDVKSINKEKPKNRFFEFSGMWKDRDITQKSIRDKRGNKEIYIQDNLPGVY